MKTLACKDLGAPECPYVAQGGTEDEVVATMTTHAMAEHKDKVDEMRKTMTDDQVMAMMRSKIKDAM